MTETKEKMTTKTTKSASVDTGSATAQVTALTAEITRLTSHMKENAKDFMARRGLIAMVGKRKKLLKYLSAKDSAAYLELIKKLGLRK